MRRVQVPRDGSSHSHDLPEKVLPAQHMHGLPPQEHYVRYGPDSGRSVRPH